MQGTKECSFLYKKERVLLSDLNIGGRCIGKEGIAIKVVLKELVIKKLPVYAGHLSEKTVNNICIKNMALVENVRY